MVGRHIKELEQGFVINGFRIKGEPVHGARFREERTIRLELHHGDHSDQVCCAKIFTGRLPFYRPWIELFDIYGSLSLGRKNVEYFGSDLEKSILKLFSDALGPGENLFVEYFRDQETRQQLQAGVPAPASRLGQLLYETGFTWFKDWYFPEGFMEGEQKLQGEKALNTAERKRQTLALMRELGLFLQKRSTDSAGDHLERAFDRATGFVSKYRPM